MGSLMAGWDCPVADPDIVKYRRNKSLTRGEIEAFWKSKKEKEDEHLRNISSLSPRTQEIIYEEAKRREDELSDMESETSLQKMILKNGWWISSNSAFLNEPPVIAQEGTAHKYVSQFHVADKASQK
ncbi:hypothetical protein BUALT_Bualt01G0030300 [Buddleja alternifolia]|uniref:Uncharacterized protein n=1 Tax=Buddleja alternifolia TaxID=168488 RepID=A0AAV6YBX8_9LAMI|nr:hypothetical protein BUALT_Bualt01G0030300 [Buddleja alternifolia]